MPAAQVKAQGGNVVWLNKYRRARGAAQDVQGDGGESSAHRPTPLSLGLKAALGLLALAVAGAFVFWALDAKQTWLALPQAIARIKPLLVTLHFTLIALAWWRWSQLVAWLFRRGWVHADNVKFALAMRNRVTLFFIAFEFLAVIRWPLGQW